MGSTNRLIVPGLPHHVILRGNNRRRIFSRSSDFLRFVRYVARALRTVEGCRLHALTMMSNHVHLIVTIAEAPQLGRFVKAFAQPYALVRNRLKEASGKLFEERFYRDPIAFDEKLANTTAYIDSNPLRAAIVDDPLDYPWTTYAIHAGRPERCRIPIEIWTPSPWYLALGDDPATRARRYAEFAAIAHAEGRKPDRHEEVEAIEALSLRSYHGTYQRRQRRPDGTQALESSPPYGNRAFRGRTVRIP